MSAHTAKTPSMSGKQEILPRPAILSDEWLRSHGVEDVEELWAAVRSEDIVMAPARLRAMKASRLSFARSLVRRMISGRWNIVRRCSDVDANGAGISVYDIGAEGYAMSFVVLSKASEGADDRIGRLFEATYDFYGALFDGHVDLDRARREVEAMNGGIWRARTDNDCLGWTIANRSNRFFSHVVERLQHGEQPDQSFLATGGGYIVRNAGWYGNGRHGSKSWLSIPRDHPLAYPFHLDIFALYLWRSASCDVAEDTARSRSDRSTRLSEDTRRRLGIGNSSGIGMVAALVRWPSWLGTFNLVRELSLAFSATRTRVDDDEFERLEYLLRKCASYYESQPIPVVENVESPARLAAGLRALLKKLPELRRDAANGARPWTRLLDETLKLRSVELEEQVNSILAEIESEFADSLAELIPAAMLTPRDIDPHMKIGQLAEIIESRYSWALDLDLEAKGAREYFWYKSEENGENRRGERAVDPGLENETFVDVAGIIQSLRSELKGADDDGSIGEFLLSRPEFCNAVSRAQLAASFPFTEIRSNILDREFLPMDGIRFLLTIMGLEASSPYSTRWVRGVFLQGAPNPEELGNSGSSDWIFPAIENVSAV